MAPVSSAQPRQPSRPRTRTNSITAAFNTGGNHISINMTGVQCARAVVGRQVLRSRPAVSYCTSPLLDISCSHSCEFPVMYTRIAATLWLQAVPYLRPLWRGRGCFWSSAPSTRGTWCRATFFCASGEKRGVCRSSSGINVVADFTTSNLIDLVLFFFLI